MQTQQTNRSSHSRVEVNPYMDQARLNALQLMLCVQLDDLLAKLGVNLYRSRKLYVGRCPIHGGDNQEALNLYPDGDSRPGYWRCNTRGCERHFKKTIIGFVRGVLSAQQHAWSWMKDDARRAAQKTTSWKEAVDWCCKFLKQDICKIKVDYEEIERRRFIADVNELTRQPNEKETLLTRSMVRKHLVIPSTYFVGRGYTPEVLDRYDVGFYPATGKALSGRVAVPIYNRGNTGVIGFTGRSIHNQCDKCKRWHSAQDACPAQNDRVAVSRTAKWYNHNFSRESCLYNLWFAEKAIRDSGVVALVEGPGDVWRAVEAGIYNVVALFGNQLSDEQQILLETSGAMDVVIMTDMDRGGDSARQQLQTRLQRSFRLHFPKLSTKDIGDMPVGNVKKEILPMINLLSRKLG